MGRKANLDVPLFLRSDPCSPTRWLNPAESFSVARDAGPPTGDRARCMKEGRGKMENPRNEIRGRMSPSILHPSSDPELSSENCCWASNCMRDWRHTGGQFVGAQNSWGWWDRQEQLSLREVREREKPRSTACTRGLRRSPSCGCPL